MTAKPTFAAVREYQLRSGEFDNETEAFRSWVRTSGFEGKHQVYERIRPNGTVLEIRTVPLPDGGAVRLTRILRREGLRNVLGLKANGVIDFSRERVRPSDLEG